MHGSEESVSSLDSILVQLGEFGKYQSFVFSLVCLAVALHSAVHIAFVFTAKDVEYRCYVPGCETGAVDPQWIHNAIPFADNRPKKCEMYQHINQTPGDCNSFEFNNKTLEQCQSFVFETKDWTILQEYGLYCESNLWKLAMVGTVNNIGQFFGLFVSGIISDRYGRKVVLIWGMVLCGICGIIRSFAPTYNWFLALEFLDAFFGAGTYACGFILGVELVGPKKRVLTGTISSSCYALGEIFVALVAWFTQSWKLTIYIVYIPPLFLAFYHWFMPESVRWYLSKGKIEEAKAVLRKTAKFNGRVLSEDTLDKLHLQEDVTTKDKQSLRDLLRSTTLLLRLINSCFCWITCAFLFYGLTLNSVTLAGNSFLDFILSALVEIPAYFACVYFVERIGRRSWQAISFLITMLSCLCFIFIPEGARAGRLVVYLLGKFGATAAFTTCYVISSEIFPTQLRHSLMGLCSTIARIGSIVAPQTPLLAQIWIPLPLVIFSILAAIAGLLTLLFPETLNIKLPDTIEEAEQIGKKKQDVEVKETPVK